MLLQEDISMAEPEQIVEEYVMPEGMLVLENASFYVELKEKCNTDIQSDMLEKVRSLKVDLEILKENNLKLMNTKLDP